MARPSHIYTAAVTVSNDFLGPAGERFIRRQITTHLGIEPEKLQTKHLNELVDWIRLTFAVLTDDARHVNDFSERLLALDRKRPIHNHGRPS